MIDSTAAATGRRLWRLLEPYHGQVYFADEPAEEYAAAGLVGRRMGYFASRSAPMGAVPAGVVVATFFNFEPGLVRRAIPDAWHRVTAARVLEARLRGADRSLRRILGAEVDSPEMAEAAGLARHAAEACGDGEGRPLYAGHAGLPWPQEPHLVLWHAASVLREFRGDGHVALLAGAGLTGCQALVQHAAAGDVPAAVLQASRAWSDDDWAAATEALRSRGWLQPDGTFTEQGRAARAAIEAGTDELAARPWAAVGEQRAGRLAELVRPFSRAIAAAGVFVVSPDTWA